MFAGSHTLCTYATATEFLAVMQARLEAQDALYGLMLGLALYLQAHPERIDHPLYLATVVDGAGGCTAALMTLPRPLYLYSDQAEPAVALRLLAENLHANGRILDSVSGLTPLSTAFAQIWSQVQGVTYQIKWRQRAFVLRKVASLAYSAGALRVATMADLDLVTQWIAAFNQEALGEQVIDLADTRQRVQVRIGDQSFYLWEDGEPVALAGTARPTPRGIAIGPVYTPPAKRGHGYATALVAQLSQRLLDNGRQFCTLFTDLTNPTSNRIYQKIGYQPLGDYTAYRFSHAEERMKAEG